MASILKGGAALTLALGLSLGAFGCSSAHIKRADLGYEALYAGELDQAQDDFEASLKKVGDYEPALTGLGLLAYERGEYKEAMGYFDRAIASEPTADALWGRGTTQLRLFQWDGAAKDLQKSVDATMNKANLELGMAYMLIGEPEDALKALQDFARVEGSTPERAMAGAQMAYRVGVKYKMPAEAAAVVNAYSFEEGSALAAEHARLLLDLAYAAGDYPTAKRAARRAGDSMDFGFVYRELSPVARRSFEGYGGAVVDMVHIGSPAYAAGMRAGDILTGFKAVPITSAAQLDDLLVAFEAQQQQQARALIEVLRDDTYYGFTVNLGAYNFDRPIADARDKAMVQPITVAADDIALWP